MAEQFESRPAGQTWIGINTSDNPLTVRNNTLFKALDIAITSKGVITSRSGWLTYRQGRTSPYISGDVITYQTNAFPKLDKNALPNKPLDQYSRFIESPVTQYSWDEMPRSETPSFVERPMGVIQDLYGYNYIASNNRTGSINSGSPFADIFPSAKFFTSTNLIINTSYYPNYFGYEKVGGMFGEGGDVSTYTVGYRLPPFSIPKVIQGYYNTARGLGDLQRVYGKTTSVSGAPVGNDFKRYQVASTPASVTAPMALDVSLSNSNIKTDIVASNTHYSSVAYRAILNQGEKGTYISGLNSGNETIYQDINYNERLSAPTARAYINTDLIPAITNISWLSGVATLTTKTNHNLTSGNLISIIQSSNSAINTDYTIQVIDSTSFTIDVTTNISSATITQWGIYKQANIVLYRPKEQYFDVSSDIRGTSLFYDYTYGQWELYRTKVLNTFNTVGLTDPGDEMYLTKIDTNASVLGMTSNKIQFIDTTKDVDLGRFLYTNPSQEGIQGSNGIAPASSCIEFYQGYMFFGGCSMPTNVLITFTDIPTEVINGTIQIQTQSVTRSFNIGETEVAGGGVVGLPDVSLSKNKRIELFAKSFVRCVNESYQIPVKAEYVSSYSDAPGQVMLRALDYDFETDITFTNQLIDSSTLKYSIVTSDNEHKANRIYYSKLQMPYAVSGFNYYDVPDNANILNMVALSNRLLILTDMGTYEVTGYDDKSFVMKAYDLTLSCVAPKTCKVFEDTLFMLSNKGIVICGNQPNNISLAWDRTWKDYINLNSIDSSHAIVDPVNREYLLFMSTQIANQQSVDLLATSTVINSSYAERTNKRCFIYNATASSWVESTFDLDAGHYTRLFPNFSGNISDTGGIMAWRTIDYYGLETVARAQTGEPYYNVDGVRTALTTSVPQLQDDGTFKQDVISAWIVNDTDYILYTNEFKVGDVLVTPYFYDGVIKQEHNLVEANILKVERKVEPVTKSVYYTIYTDVWVDKVFDVPSNTVYNQYSVNETSVNRYVITLSNTSTMAKVQHMRQINHRMVFHPFNAGSSVTRKKWSEVQITYRGNTLSRLSIFTNTDEVKRLIETKWINTEFNKGYGSGTFGNLPFGNPNIPDEFITVRLLVPAEHQTGRNLNITLQHDAIDEDFILIEVAVLYEIISTNTVI